MATKVYVTSKRDVLGTGWSNREAFATVEAAKRHIESLLGADLIAAARWSDSPYYCDLYLNSDLINFAVARITFLSVEG